MFRRILVFSPILVKLQNFDANSALLVTISPSKRVFSNPNRKNMFRHILVFFHQLKSNCKISDANNALFVTISLSKRVFSNLKNPKTCPSNYFSPVTKSVFENALSSSQEKKVPRHQVS